LNRIVHWKQLIEEAVYDPKKLAKEVRVSLRQLQRYWKHVHGISPKSALRELRLEAAKSLLNQGRLLVKEIAFKLGYKKTSHFCADFKRYTGSTPSRFVELAPVADAASCLTIKDGTTLSAVHHSAVPFPGSASGLHGHLFQIRERPPHLGRLE